MKKTKVIVVGLDGLEPKIVDHLFQRAELPNLAALRDRGGYARLGTTYPAQTPVAWSTFATGTNPGGHGIFDFLRREPRNNWPELALNRHEQKNAFVPPRAVNLRRGEAVWSVLSRAGIPSTVLRCPCTYPPDAIAGRMLAGMGVPDLRGGLGTATFYTSAGQVPPGESENLVPLAVHADGTVSTHLLGPRNPRSGTNHQLDITLRLDRDHRRLEVYSPGQPRVLEVKQGTWSDWLKVKFKTGWLQAVPGMVRFHLVRLDPAVELYASPINFDPENPLFPISSPPTYAAELARAVGNFHTTGMVEDHGGLNNGRFSELAYLDQCGQAWRERERMLFHELDRFKEGLFYCLFDTPDRIQHMFWRFREPDHPAHPDRNREGEEEKNDLSLEDAGQVIEEHYRQCDALIGRVLPHVDERTLLIVLSDHGFNSFQRGVHVNTLLHDMGLLRLKEGVQPGAEAGDFFRSVDWSQTRAYALGLAGIYLNLAGREQQGIVPAEEAGEVAEAIVSGLTGLKDPEHDRLAIRRVSRREQIYSGPYAGEAPDLIVNFAEKYRVSWGTALGGVPSGHFEDNVKKWSGDHIIDPDLVPGVLFMNQPHVTEGVEGEGASLVDLAPTILAALGIPKTNAMEGRSLLP
jgi:predicted AlkP superfamily phosphohydrolase/phosphomutase